MHLGPFTPLGIATAALLIVGSVIAAWAPPVKAALGLTAARAVSRPWTLLTCAFVGDVGPSLAYAVAALFLLRIVEPLHGARELVKYLAFAIACASFFTVGVVTAGYYSSVLKEKAGADHAGDMLFRPLGGFEAGIAALLVALKQQIPDNEVALLGGALKFRAMHLPALFAVGTAVGSLALGGALRVIPFTLLGTYFAWAYLRFLQSNSGVRGDLSEEFALATFFPQPLQPPVETLAAACTRVTGLGDGGGQQHQAAWRAALVGGAALPGSIADTGDAARRRERGARALEERLGLKRAASAASTNAGAEAPSGGDAAPAAAPTKAATPTKLSPGKPADPDLEAGEAEAAADDSS